MSHPKFDFSALGAEERIQLVEDLWNSLPDVPELPSPPVGRRNR